MTRAEILARLSDGATLATTALAEAGGDATEGGSSVEERIAVMCVVRNRLRTPGRYGNTYKAVCHQPKQFSCWTDGPDANHQRLMTLCYLLVTDQPLDNPYLDETLFLAGGVMSGTMLDRVSGATHYYAPAAMRPAGRTPGWALGKTPCARVGTQLFFKGV